MIQQKQVFTAVILISLILALKDLRKFLRYRHLKQFGIPATAVIVAIRHIPQKNVSLTQVDIEYKNRNGQLQKAQVFAPKYDDSFDYMVGNEIGIRYDSLRSEYCEVENTLHTPWWRSPLSSALILLAIVVFVLGLLCKWW